MKANWTTDDIEKLLSVHIEDEHTWPEALRAERDRQLGLDTAAEMTDEEWADQEGKRVGQLTLLVARRLVDQSTYSLALYEALRSLLPEDGPARKLLVKLDNAHMRYWMDGVKVADRIERYMGEWLPTGQADKVLQRAMAL